MNEIDDMEKTKYLKHFVIEQWNTVHQQICVDCNIRNSLVLYEFGWNCMSHNRWRSTEKRWETKKRRKKTTQTIMCIPPFVQSNSFWVCNTNSQQHTTTPDTTCLMLCLTLYIKYKYILYMYKHVYSICMNLHCWHLNTGVAEPSQNIL